LNSADWVEILVSIRNMRLLGEPAGPGVRRGGGRIADEAAGDEAGGRLTRTGLRRRPEDAGEEASEEASVGKKNDARRGPSAAGVGAAQRAR
jgi:hypothetical protein